MQLYTLHCIGSRITSKLIKLVTGGKYTHTAILFKINGELAVIEMQKNGCEIKSFQTWKKEFNYKFDISYNEKNNIDLGVILSYSDAKGYDFENFIIKQPIKAIKERITGKKVIVKADKDEDERYICSEFVAKVYGWENYQSYTPQEVYDRCKKEEKFISINEL